MACGADTVAGKVTQTTRRVAVGELGSIVGQGDNELAVAAVVLVLKVVGVRRFACLVTDLVNSRTRRRLGKSGRKEQGWIASCRNMFEASYLEVNAVVVAVRELVCLWHLREAADPVQDVVGSMTCYLGYELENGR
jgi:hypothetical protein